VGAAQAGEHFIAITDPGSSLIALAQSYAFRATFLNDPNIGGRYSALSYFGILPAALAGVDLPRLLRSAGEMTEVCSAQQPAAAHPAALLGAALGALAQAGRDKVTFILSPQLASFGDWVEQLIAESTGKEGRGILPVAGEALAEPSLYGSDRFFVAVHLAGDPIPAALEALQAAGHPIARLVLPDVYALGGQFFLWELATAIAGWRLGINPFDQPNVEAAKAQARKVVAAYKSSGELPTPPPAIQQEGIRVYGETSASSPQEALRLFLASANPGDYLAILAFLQPLADTRAELEDLRHGLRAATRLAVTSGYGPRYLHSTGQLHKGDAGNGLFLLLTAESTGDAPIPDQAGNPASAISFATLKMAQALGDEQALLQEKRRLLRFHFEGNPATGIRELAATF
jgi:hypothetical protein